jgi:hypothetical protein
MKKDQRCKGKDDKMMKMMGKMMGNDEKNAEKNERYES